jgi:hypothetical protein
MIRIIDKILGGRGILFETVVEDELSGLVTANLGL